MRMEVHVHGSIFLGRGVRLSQVEHALRPWLEYLDVETVAEAPSLEREEPGIVFELARAHRQHLLDRRGRPQLSRAARGSFPEHRPPDRVRLRDRGHLLSREQRRRVLPALHRADGGSHPRVPQAVRDRGHLGDALPPPREGRRRPGIGFDQPAFRPGLGDEEGHGRAAGGSIDGNSPASAEQASPLAEGGIWVPGPGPVNIERAAKPRPFLIAGASFPVPWPPTRDPVFQVPSSALDRAAWPRFNHPPPPNISEFSTNTGVMPNMVPRLPKTSGTTM